MRFLQWKIGILIVLVSTIGRGQEIKVVQDVGVWTSAELKHKFNKNWQGSFAQHFRFFDNIRDLHGVISDIGIVHRLNDYFKLGGNLRYSYSRKKDLNFTHDIRYNVDFKCRLKLGDNLNFKYRFRYQHNFNNLFTFYNDIKRKSNVRNRIRLQYQSKKHAPYFSTELFRAYAIYKKPGFNNLRLMLGDQVQTRNGRFDYALGYERELNDDYPLNLFFLKLNYTFRFKHE